jgi:hypothetical protein
MKVPLKIRIFIWFHYKKVVWTKDNIIKRKWAECKKCTFYDDDETVGNLFIRCKFAKLVWQVVHFNFNIPPPNINLFGNWALILKLNHAFKWEFVPSFGLFGIAEMM